MAERIHDPPEPAGYPWDQWTDGQWWQVTRGTDYDCDPSSLQAYLYRVGAKRNLKVHSRRQGDTIVFQFKKG